MSLKLQMKMWENVVGCLLCNGAVLEKHFNGKASPIRKSGKNNARRKLFAQHRRIPEQ